MSNLNISDVKSWLDNQSDELKDYPFWAMASEDQMIAAYAILSGRFDCVALMGRAGSGKTHLVRHCRNMLQMLDCEVHITATTGIASSNAGGEGTINKFAGLKSGNSTLPQGLFDDVENHWKRVSITRRANDVASVDLRSTADLVIFIDEISMMSSENLFLTLQILRYVCRNRRIRFVCTGDFRQLLIVNKKQELPWQEFQSLAFEPSAFNPAGSEEIYEAPSLFESGTLDGKPWRAVTISLMTNHRQKSGAGWFVDALNALGDGNNFNHPLVAPMLNRVWVSDESGGSFNFKSKEPLPDLSEAVHLFSSNSEVASHNREALKVALAKGAECQTYTAKISPGSWTREEILNEVAPLEESVTLAVGLKFMLRVNLSAELNNGTIGVITQLDEDAIKITLPDGTAHWIGMTSIPLPKNKRGVAVGTFEAIPGVLAHALTPWKSQGLTIDAPVVYHLNKWYAAHGQLYVAASRVTKPEYLFILTDNMKKLNKGIVCEEKVKAFILKTENNMRSALGESVTYPQVWSRADQDTLWVRDYQVQDVDYVANPKGELIATRESCDFYKLGAVGGLLVKDAEALGELLMTDDVAFEWFKTQIQYVWFLPQSARQAA